MEKNTITLNDLISISKDRLWDDLRGFLDDNCDTGGFGVLNPSQREQLRGMFTLLAMPDDQPETLAALSVNYFNGVDDHLFEDHVLGKGLIFNSHGMVVYNSDRRNQQQVGLSQREVLGLMMNWPKVFEEKNQKSGLNV